MVLRRRRPLARAAMVGGAGYVAGRRMAAREEHEANQDERLGQVQQTPSAPSPLSQTDRIEALTKLKGLLDSGVLSQDEFNAEKQKLLKSG